MSLPKGTRQPGVAERIEAELAKGLPVTAEGVARRTGCNYWTASRYLHARHLARAVNRHKAENAGAGRKAWLYSRRDA